ncbi:hypothetical protein TNIN_277021 [Trichonephila inaurata madagascariensis]|uniref:Uncharacterized protein n=1 Tax=Trichonephila inaurata madagascariensis TaxID=2747483 RepID=A0A8X6WNH1_9ARAC|nr:hypothetical protein TNIN_277021 [Trichonephila inaurata madagascariensis]
MSNNFETHCFLVYAHTHTQSRFSISHHRISNKSLSGFEDIALAAGGCGSGRGRGRECRRDRSRYTEGCGQERKRQMGSKLGKKSNEISR